MRAGPHATDVRHPDASRHLLTIRARIAPLSAGRGKPALKNAARYRMSIRMTKETTPLWVWLSVALLAIGTLAYVTAVYLIEHIM
jgi:hypothetical protein